MKIVGAGHCRPLSGRSAMKKPPAGAKGCASTFIDALQNNAAYNADHAPIVAYGPRAA
ncbi:unannotated protein [freshwater metagenome]|uniref:Unannotated protein n=1 Tax=freshwater metagenome TaxID=449393 RepID=A0A6J7QUQ6_9ZZZZ